MPDFFKYNIYIDGVGVMLHETAEERMNTTEPLPLQATRQDTGNSNEIRPEYGTFFGQGDFSHGALQQWFHKPGSDSKRFYDSDGFDVFHQHSAEHGSAVHLMVAPAMGASPPASVPAGTNHAPTETVGGTLFVGWGTALYKTTSPMNPTWSTEAVHNGEAATDVYDLAAAGDEMYAALGANGIHVRSAAGAWTHYNAALARRVAYVKDRLMATADRQIYEIIASGAAPSPIETLPLGWEFTSLWEANGFIYASAVNVSSGLCRVHHYGLNDTGTAVAKIGSTPMPRHQLVYYGVGYLGQAYLGVGKLNADGGYDPVIYQGIIDGEGFLNLVKLAEGVGAGASDLAVRHIEPYGETLIAGWSLGTDAPFGSREGLAVIHPGRDGFANYIRRSALDGGTVYGIRSISVYKGHVVCSTPRTFLWQDHMMEEETRLVTSIGDHNTTGDKTFDFIELATDPLPMDTSVTVEYTTDPPKDGNWTLAGTLDDDGSTGERFPIDVRSHQLALRIKAIPSADGMMAPEVLSFLVRSNPSPSEREFVLTRTVRLVYEDRIGEDSAQVGQNVVSKYKALQDMMYEKVIIEEPGGIKWDARCESVMDWKPGLEAIEVTRGDSSKMGFIMRMTFTAKRVDS